MINNYKSSLKKKRQIAEMAYYERRAKNTIVRKKRNFPWNVSLINECRKHARRRRQDRPLNVLSRYGCCKKRAWDWQIEASIEKQWDNSMRFMVRKQSPKPLAILKLFCLKKMPNNVMMPHSLTVLGPHIFDQHNE